VDTAEARAVLAVGPAAGADEIRTAFRRELRRTHPDVATDVDDANRRTARLVQAYTVLRRAPSADGATTTLPPAGRRPTITAAGESLRWNLPADETLRLLVDAADAVGDITYLDVEAGLLDVVVLTAGTACSLMATVSDSSEPGSPPATEVRFALEPLGGEARPAAGPVVAAVAAHLARAQAAAASSQSNSGSPQARRPT
jgi:hypothetical protein